MKDIRNREADIRLSTKWLGLTLRNPIVLGSLTLISHARIQEQVEFYLKAEEYGVGAIVLDSFVPIEFGQENFKHVINNIKIFRNELNNKGNDEAGFALLGPAYPNISSIKYGINLVKELKKKVQVPIICSLVNLGDENSFIKSAINLEKAGADAIELNFSCPNIVLPLGGNHIERLKEIPFSLELVRKVKESLNIELSIKVEPNDKYLKIFDEDKTNILKSITYANAYIGLYPPSLEYPFSSQFDEEKEWTFSGIYGSFNRLMTYKEIAMIKKKIQNIKVSAVGGILNATHPLEALLIGADTIQLSSGVMWEGLKLIQKSISNIMEFMVKNNFKSIDEFRGISLKYIKDRVDNIDKYNVRNVLDNIVKSSNMTITNKCIRCKSCLDSGCLAIKEKEDGEIYIDKDLCSMCGWCKQKCSTKGAIT